MFGLTFEKLVVVTIIAGFVIGPHRLPIYAAQLAGFVRDLRRFVETTRARAEDDLGMPLRTSDWQMDLTRYDPRRIVRDALDDDLVARDVATTQMPAQSTHGAASASVDAAAAATPEETLQPVTQQRWIVAGGTSGHPRRRASPPEVFPEQAQTIDLPRVTG